MGELELPPGLGRRGLAADALAPDGSEIRLLVDGRQGAARSSLVEVTLAAGLVSRPVYHRTVEEVWYVLEGAGWVWRSRRGAVTALAVEVGPGDALVIPVGWSFQFAAGAGGALRFLCHTTPGWPGDGEAVPAGEGGLGAATV